MKCEMYKPAFFSSGPGQIRSLTGLLLLLSKTDMAVAIVSQWRDDSLAKHGDQCHRTVKGNIWSQYCLMIVNIV